MPPMRRWRHRRCSGSRPQLGGDGGVQVGLRRRGSGRVGAGAGVYDITTMPPAADPGPCDCGTRCIFAVSSTRGGGCEYYGEGGGGDYSLHDFLRGVLLALGEEKGPADAGRFAGCGYAAFME